MEFMKLALTNNIKPMKSASHHWWPQCISKRWVNDENVVHQLFWDGRDIAHKNTKNFGAIGNAHLIKFSDKPTDWDESFEKIFDLADRTFPNVLDWIESLQGNFNPLKEEQENLDILLECLLSLVVRSPSFRNSISNIGRITTDEICMKLNQRDTLVKFKTALSGHGKFAVLFSSEHEFIFGDGFYHNFTSSIAAPIEPRIIVPILPNICIFYSRPMSYRTNPRLITKELTKNDIDFINQTTITYSRDYIFYRQQRPDISENFSCKKFLEYHPNGDPVIDAFLQIFK